MFFFTFFFLFHQIIPAGFSPEYPHWFHSNSFICFKKKNVGKKIRQSCSFLMRYSRSIASYFALCQRAPLWHSLQSSGEDEWQGAHGSSALADQTLLKSGRKPRPSRWWGSAVEALQGSRDVLLRGVCERRGRRAVHLGISCFSVTLHLSWAIKKMQVGIFGI